MTFRTSILQLWLGGSLAFLASACEDAPRGELMVSVTSDLAVPDDIDHLTWSITLEGEPKPFWVKTMDLRRGIDLPATLAIESGAGTASPITIRVEGRKGETTPLVRVAREARVVVPSDRVAKLDLPL